MAAVPAEEDGRGKRDNRHSCLLFCNQPFMPYLLYYQPFDAFALDRIKPCFATSPPLWLHAPLPLGIPVGHPRLHWHQFGAVQFPRVLGMAIDALQKGRPTRESILIFAGLLVAISLVKGILAIRNRTNKGR